MHQQSSQYQKVNKWSEQPGWNSGLKFNDTILMLHFNVKIQDNSAYLASRLC